MTARVQPTPLTECDSIRTAALTDRAGIRSVRFVSRFGLAMGKALGRVEGPRFKSASALLSVQICLFLSFS